MKTALSTCSALCAMLLAASAASGHTLYAAPGGRGDACTQNAPCDLFTARDVARRLIPTMKQNLIVSLASGTYHLTSTFVLTPADSGANGFDVIYRSAKPLKAHLSGGTTITGWGEAENGIFIAHTPGSLRFRQLYVSGARAIRARTPNGHPATDLDWNQDDMSVSFAQPLAGISDLRGVELVATRHWQQHRLHLIAVKSGPGKRQSATLDSAEAYVSFNAMGETLGDDQPYYLENSLTFLDSPGEWFHDTATNRLYYMPRPGENLTDVVVPSLRTLVLLEGHRHHFVHNIAFEGITFEYAGWNGPTREGFIQVQATWRATLDGAGYMPAAVEVRGVGSNHIRFSNNVIQHFGADGLDFYKGTSDNQIIANSVTDGSGQGIAIDADPSRFDYSGPGSRNILVADNRVSKIGVDYTGSVGIFAGYVNGARIEHNAVSDLPYTGISVGWGWTLETNPSGNNIIRANDIHDVMQLHDDGAAIYLLSRQPGTVVEQNYIHGVRRAAGAGNHPVAGIYLDNGTSEVAVRGNVITDVSKRINVNRDSDPAQGTFPAKDNDISDVPTLDPAIIAAAGPSKSRAGIAQ